MKAKPDSDRACHSPFTADSIAATSILHIGSIAPSALRPHACKAAATAAASVIAHNPAVIRQP